MQFAKLGAQTTKAVRLGPKPKISQQLCNFSQKMKNPDDQSDSDSMPPDERPNNDRVSHPVKDRKDEGECVDDMEEDVKNSKQIHVIRSPVRVASKKAHESTTKLSKDQTELESVYQSSATKRRPFYDKRYSEANAGLASSMMSNMASFSNFNGSEISQLSPITVEKKPRKCKRTRNRSMEPQGSTFMSRVIEKRYKEIVLNTPKSEAMVKSPRNQGLNKGSTSKVATQAADKGRAKGLQYNHRKTNSVASSVKTTPLRSSRPQPNGHKVNNMKQAKEDPPPIKTVVVNLENLERIVGRKKLDEKGLKRTVLHKQDISSHGHKVADANNSILYLYLEPYFVVSCFLCLH